MNFLGIEEEFASYNSSPVVILPVPYEQTTSYIGGTADGPRAILEASAYVELYDEELDFEMYRLGVHTAPALKFCGTVEEDFELISSKIDKLLEDKKFVVSLGGEHSISWPLYRPFHERFNNISVLQLDAHSDLREEYEGSKYSHAAVMHRIWEVNQNIVQLGIRSQCVEEGQLIRDNNINTWFARRLKKDGFKSDILDQLTENVYLTIDVDYFDPSIMPATGTPEPGGFLWDETLDFMQQLFKQKNVVGFDVVELSPIRDLVHPDFLAAKLIYKLLGFKYHMNNRQMTNGK